MADLSFLGRGMKFPPQINEATGRFVISSEEQSVRESLYLILMTQISERVMRPEFGSSLMSYTFVDINESNVLMVTRSLEEQIMMHEPRVTNVSVTADVQSRRGAVLFDVGYTIRMTNVQDNFVFPFYLNTEEEAPEEEPQYYDPEVVEEIEV
ncbi:MAG: GPW/gp25 family protein [Lachnospiraceae bacterium]|nr:GPW/gp25 family protein [Lachnospiraceae bacterium]